MLSLGSVVSEKPYAFTEIGRFLNRSMVWLNHSSVKLLKIRELVCPPSEGRLVRAGMMVFDHH